MCYTSFDNYFERYIKAHHDSIIAVEHVKNVYAIKPMDMKRLPRALENSSLAAASVRLAAREMIKIIHMIEL
jgi:hypothetical protein